MKSFMYDIGTYVSWAVGDRSFIGKIVNHIETGYYVVDISTDDSTDSNLIWAPCSRNFQILDEMQYRLLTT